MNIDLISPKIIGERVILGPAREDLNDTYRRWLHDPETSTCLVASRLLTHSEENEWLAMNSRAGNVFFTAYDKESGAPIGSTGFMFFDQVARSAEFGILIGEKEYQNRGYGTEATVLTIDYGFNILNLASIFLRVHSFNERAIKVYEKVGFKKIGLRRRAYFVGGQYYDDLFMDILQDEFSSGSLSPLVQATEK
jgi:RimJ/RimL family protein N-acetyltransferase